VILSLLALAVGCKGKPKHQNPPTNLAGGSGSSAPKTAPDIVLPAGPGTPPDKTTKPLDIEKLKKLSQMTFPGFQIEPRAASEKVLELRQKTEDHPKIWATVTIQPCFDCVPMDLPKWKEKTDSLKLFLTDELKSAPDTVFEVGATDLHGAPMIYTYQLAQFAGSGHGAYSHAYCLYYNDGINSIRVLAQYKDDPMATKEAMAQAVPRTDLENVAKAFVDVYTHAW
jgi:hypothetical protein